MIPFPSQTAAMFGMIPSYKVEHFHVFFGDRYLPNTNWFGFEDLGQGYGKNTKQVFYMGELIPDANAFSFEVLENGYAKDKRRTFHHGSPVDHTTSFQFQSQSQKLIQTMYSMQPVSSKFPMIQMPYTGGMISPMFQREFSYVVENFHVFFNHQYLPDANWIHFIDLGQGYGKDERHIFYMGQMIDNAHSFTFEVLNKGYAKDRQHVYQYGQVVTGLNPFLFNGI